MNKETLFRLKESLEALQPVLEGANDTPSTAFGVGDENKRRILSTSDTIEIRQKLSKLSTSELWSLFREQAVTGRDSGVNAEAWIRSGGKLAYDTANANPGMRKLLDSTAGTALVRQDLEPILYQLFIRAFPAWERFRKEPANGPIHAYDRQTSYGDAQFMTELGTVTDDTGAYERASSNIAIIGTRRGVSLKNQFATVQSGSGFNPEQLELQNGLLAIAHRMQKTIFQGNASVSSGTGANEDGAYDANGFDGLRQLLNGDNGNTPETVDPNGQTPEDMRSAFNDAAISTMQLAGNVSLIYIDPIAKGQFDVQQDPNVRYMSTTMEVAPGILTNAVNATPFGPLPLFVVPGDSIGEYTYSAETVSDAYLIDENSITLPYLGSEGITTVEIPPGLSGQLTHLYIMYGMWGLALKAPTFNNKVRIVRPT